ncbi:A-kinase anchor protein 12, partial [Stegastes partitus]
MGDAQSAQRDAKRDAEQSGAGEDAEAEHSPEDKPLENKEPISEINGKAAGSLAGFNVHSEDAAEGIPSPDKDVSDVEINAKKLADEDEEVPVKMIEMEAKQNEINESFRRFFSNIGLKLTVKKGSAEKDEIQVPGEEPNKQEDIKDTAKETKSENGKQNKDLNAAQEGYDNDSTTGPTMTEGTSEDFLANAEEKTTETKKEADSNKADAASTSYASEGGHQEAATEEVVASPFKRFFKTGIFSGIRRKRKEPAEKELVDMGKKEGMETMEQTVQDQQQDKEEVEVWKELQEIKPKDEAMSAASAQTTDEAKSPSTDPSAIIVTESEILSSQEKVQASPMKRLLSGSSLKRRSKKQRGRKLSDGKLSDSGEHSSDNFMSSTESADNPREDSSPQSSTEATGEEDGPWASFKKLMTPKKRAKGSSSGPEEAQGHEAKPSEGEQASDQSAEEGRKRKDSSVSWEAVLCGSGRRRSRKTSDSEDEAPQNDDADNKQDSGTKQGTETPLESSNEVHEDLASPLKQAGSPPEGDGGSTWKSFKKLVTPKRKAKDENESRDNIHSDSEITQDDSSFSIKKLLPGRKKRKSDERQDQVSSDEAEKEAASGDEDSETPAVVPLSEFETAETGVQIQTQADIESYAPKELEDKLQQDLPHDKAEPVIPCDNQQIEAEKVPKKEEALKSEGSTAPGTDEEADEDSISKHQQLSDITEEGAITDTMATPASTNEEAARDDTIAEDLIEITSEAITAPEPVDVTLADETEMISAVSQLSESSKTSGNTTPVPTEHDDKDTELLLQNVAENISKSPEAAPVCSEQPSSERIVGSDAPIELAATAQTESVSDANDAMSTDIVSEVPTEEFNTAEITVDDAYKEDVSQLQDTISELEATDDSQHLMECVSEVNEAVSAEALPKDEEVVPDSIAGADEAEISKTASQDAESAALVADGTKDGVMEQENQILAEKEDQVLENVPEQVSVEDQPPVVADEQEALTTDTLVSEKDSVHSPKKDVPFSEDILSEEKVSDEPKEIAEHLTEVTDEPENKEPQTEAPKIDQHVTEVVQEAVVDAEEGSVQSLEKEVTSEEVPPEEIVKDKANDETVPPAKVSAEQVDASKTEPIQEPEALQGVQATTLDSEAGSPETLLPEETVRDEPQEDMVPFPEVEVKLFDSSKTKHIQEPEVLEAATLDSEAGSRDTIQPAETVSDEPKEETVPSPEVEVKLVDASKNEHIQEVLQAATLDSEAGSRDTIQPAETVRDEPKEKTVPSPEVEVKLVDASKTEHIQEPEVLQAATLDSEVSSSESNAKEVISEDIPSEGTLRAEPKVEPVPLAEDNVEPVDTPKTEHIQETEASQTVQAAALEPEADSPQAFEKEVIPKEVQPEEAARDEPKEEPVPLVEGNVESLDASKDKHIQEPETLQAAPLNSEADSSQLTQTEVISGDVPPVKTVSEEAQEKPVPLAEGNVESIDAFEIKHIQEPETLQAATLNSEEGSPELPQKEVTSEDVPPDD